MVIASGRTMGEMCTKALALAADNAIRLRLHRAICSCSSTWAPTPYPEAVVRMST